MILVRALLAALAVVALLAGCGDDSDDDPAPAEPRRTEAADSVRGLPDDWEVHANRAGGFAFGLPPGWKARDRGTTTQIRSFDGLVVLGITADRTSESLAIEPAESATRTLASLSAFAEPLEPGEPRKVDHRYEAYEASGRGRSTRSGLVEDVTVVVLRREGAVTVTVSIFANADKQAKPARRIADRVVETLRTQPPNAAVR